MTSVSRRPDANWLAKVPEIGVAFWVIKVLTTGMGEAASDFLGKTNLALGGVVGIGGFVLALFGKPHSFGGGLGFGDGTVTAVLIIAIAALVAYAAIRRSDIQPPVPVREVDPDLAPQQV